MGSGGPRKAYLTTRRRMLRVRSHRSLSISIWSTCGSGPPCAGMLTEAESTHSRNDPLSPKIEGASFNWRLCMHGSDFFKSRDPRKPDLGPLREKGETIALEQNRKLIMTPATVENAKNTGKIAEELQRPRH